MRSADVLDRHASDTGAPQVRDLLVLWQHPNTREMVPVGRFAYDGTTYSFSYTRAATAVQDFRPLPGLGDLHRRYESTRLPSVFEQRVMESDRPDYGEYLETLGLEPSRATPWEQIVESGGTRAGDTLQFMQVPTVSDGRARARFLANGIRHIAGQSRSVGGRIIAVSPEDQEEAIRQLRPGASVAIEPEDDNPHDPCALLMTSGGVPLGWVPRAMSTSVRELANQRILEAIVVRVGGPTVPAHLRLVLDLDVEAPPGFEFDREGRWEPLDQ